MEAYPISNNTRAFIQQITRSDLRDLVFAVRCDQPHPKGSGIEQLDRIIHEEQERVKNSYAVTEEAQEILEQSKNTMVPEEDDEKQGGFRNGDMVEIQGPSGCGKTELVYQLTISRIIPFSYTFLRSPSSPLSDTAEEVHVEFGGPSLSAVIYSLTSAPYSLTRLSSLLRSHIQSTLLQTFSQSEINLNFRDQIDVLIRTCLRRVRLCKISEGQGMWGLAIALKSFRILVESELEKTEEVGLVAIDGFGESFWADRAIWEEGLRERDSKKRKAVSSLDKSDRDDNPNDENSVVKEKEKEKEEDISMAGKLTDDKEDALKNQSMYQVLLQLTSIRQRYSPLIVLTTQLLCSSTNTNFKANLKRPHTQVSSSPSNMHLFTSTHLPYPYYHPFPPFKRAPPKEIRGITYHVSLESSGINHVRTIKKERKETGGKIESKKFKGWVKGKGWIGPGREGREF